MAELSKIAFDGAIYDLKDTVARNALTGGMHFLGECIDPTSLNDTGNQAAYIKTGASTCVVYYTGTEPTTTTYSFGGNTYTITEKITLKAGDIAISGKMEFVFSDADNKWHEFGSTGSLKALAFKDRASTPYTPTGSVSSTFTGRASSHTHTVTQGLVAASGDFTPAGTVVQGSKTNATVIKSYPGVTGKLETATIHDTPTTTTTTLSTANVIETVTAQASKLTTTTITGVSGSNTVPGMTASVSGETLTLTTSEVTVPKASTTSTTVATGSLSTTGQGDSIVIGVSTTNQAVVTGLVSGTTVVTGLTAGAAKTVATGSITATGTGSIVMTGLGTAETASVIQTIGNPIFTGTQGTISVTGTTTGVSVADTSITPSGSINSSFTGNSTTITVQ